MYSALISSKTCIQFGSFHQMLINWVFRKIFIFFCQWILRLPHLLIACTIFPYQVRLSDTNNLFLWPNSILRISAYLKKHYDQFSILSYITRWILRILALLKKHTPDPIFFLSPSQLKILFLAETTLGPRLMWLLWQEKKIMLAEIHTMQTFFKYLHNMISRYAKLLTKKIPIAWLRSRYISITWLKSRYASFLKTANKIMLWEITIREFTLGEGTV